MPLVTLQQVCTHHWVIEEPAGEWSEGVCRYCFESRKFNNGSTSSWLSYEDYRQVWQGAGLVRSSDAVSPAYLK